MIDSLSEMFSCESHLLSHIWAFFSSRYGLLTLSTDEYEVLQEGDVCPTAPIGLIGAGTGLGECFLTCHNEVYDAFPTEGGHVEFAPRSDLENELVRYLAHKFGCDGSWGRVSAERIVSGKGIVNVYEFLANKFPSQVSMFGKLCLLLSNYHNEDLPFPFCELFSLNNHSSRLR